MNERVAAAKGDVFRGLGKRGLDKGGRTGGVGTRSASGT